MQNDLSYLIITFNGAGHIKRCVESIRLFDKNGFILLVDNNSSDDTIKIANSCSIDKIIKLKQNLGFGKANNIGLKYLHDNKFNYFFLVNQDVYFEQGDYEKFIKLSRQCLNQDFAIVSPIHMAPSNEDFDFKFRDYISHKNTPNFFSDYAKEQLKEVYVSKVVNAAAWLISAITLEKIGYFDPIFDHYGEDTDYIKRVFFKSMNIALIPSFKVIHNRPQQERNEKARIEKSIKIWALTYFKDLNSPLIKLLTLFPFELYKRLYSKNQGLLIYFKVWFYVIFNITNLIRSRAQSRKDFAFSESIEKYG